MEEVCAVVVRKGSHALAGWLQNAWLRRLLWSLLTAPSERDSRVSFASFAETDAAPLPPPRPLPPVDVDEVVTSRLLTGDWHCGRCNSR